MVLLLLSLQPFERRRWWLFLVGGVFVHLASFAALIAFPDFGPPELSAHLILAGVMAVYFLGAGLAFKPSAPTNRR